MLILSFPIHFRTYPIPDFSYLLHFMSNDVVSSPSSSFSILGIPIPYPAALFQSVSYLIQPRQFRSLPYLFQSMPLHILAVQVCSIHLFSIPWQNPSLPNLIVSDLHASFLIHFLTHLFLSSPSHLSSSPFSSMSCLLLSLPFLVGTNPIYSLSMLHNTFPVHMTSVRPSTVPFRF